MVDGNYDNLAQLMATREDSQDFVITGLMLKEGVREAEKDYHLFITSLYEAVSQDGGG